MIGSAALLLACAGDGRVLVITNSAQPRLAPPITCEECDTLDLAADTRPGRRYEVAVLDGHSLPGEGMLGVDESTLVDALSAADPRWIVAATCYAAEIGTLEHLFARSSRLEEVRAAPSTVPWSLPAPDAGCLGASSRPDRCFHLPERSQVYDRTAVASLAEAGREAVRAELRACRVPPRFVRLRPHYLCVDDGRASALLRVDPARIEPACIAEHPDRYLVDDCGVRGDGVPVPGALAP